MSSSLRHRQHHEGEEGDAPAASSGNHQTNQQNAGMPSYSRPARLVYSQLPRGINPAANRATLSSYRFRIAIVLTITVIYTAFLYRSGVFLFVVARHVVV
jgi:hypothetical protein